MRIPKIGRTPGRVAWPGGGGSSPPPPPPPRARSAEERWGDLLDPGERILWEGAPNPALFVFRRSDLFQIPFSIAWTGFIVFWIWGASVGGAPILFMLPGVLMFFFGLYITVGRFFIDAYRRRHTAYGLTTKRALIVREGRWPRRIDKPLTPMTHVEVKPGHLGTITFDPNVGGGHADARGRLFGAEGNDVQFFQIPDVERVHDLIRQVQRDATEARASR